MEGEPASALIKPNSICGRSVRLRLIGARAVHPRNSDAQQTIINRELRAVMNVMVQDHAPNAGNARHSKNLLTPGEQPPVLHHFGVADSRERRARFAYVLVKLGQQLFSI